MDEQERELVLALYGPLWRFAAVVGSKPDEPDDLVQEAFFRVLRRGRLSDLEEPLAYLRRTILNLASNNRRRLGRWRNYLRLTNADDTFRVPSYPSDLADLLALPPGSRAVIYLADVEGYSFQDIAAMLGCSEGAARQRASRARKHLRSTMAQED